jgi:small subunit ribosomal protein S27e
MAHFGGEPRGKFIRARCAKCKNEQVLFDRAATPIKCLVCGERLASPTGGKIKVDTQVLEILD